MPRENDRTSQRKFTDVYPAQGISVSLVQGDWLLPHWEEGLSRTDWMVTILGKEGNCPGRPTGIATDPCTRG